MKDKTCAVCGDRAIGNNFGALSCESCRLFFRRNIHKINQLKCVFGNHCLINFDLRKSCKRCRIVKCIEKGMRKRKDTSRRIRCHQSISSDSGGDWTSWPSVASIDLIHLDRNHCDYRCQQKSNHIACIPAMIRGFITDLSDTEIKRFRSLFAAASHLKDQSVESLPLKECKDFSLALSLIQQRCDIKCRRIVQMTTNLAEFAVLGEDDKVALVKAACKHIPTLMSISNFDFDRLQWIFSLDKNFGFKVSINHFKSVSPLLYECHRNFLFSFKEQWSQDNNILDLLIAISLYDPNQHNLFNKVIVEYEQIFYKYLLRRYLQLKHKSTTEAEHRFQRLMTDLQDVYHITQLSQSMYSNKPETLESAGLLVKEIYDIKTDENWRNQ